MRRINSALFISILTLITAHRAGATLVTFEITGQVGCTIVPAGECERFKAAAGLDSPGSWDYRSVFTVDTSASPYSSGRFGSSYRVNQPGTGVSIAIGNLTLFYSDFYLGLRDIGNSNDVVVATRWGDFTGGSGLDIGAFPPSYVFSDYTLEELTRIDLSRFSGTPFDTWITDPAGTWRVFGNAMTIRLTPEPGAL
ncbi:MAG TPA: hypothetical protein VFV10_14535, partial [Gammaproteobacteria bacterium]|nr:hypothetical protein [Gammaproteobacteria bacterium]